MKKPVSRGAVVFSSNSEGEFGEDVRDLVPRIDVGALHELTGLPVVIEDRHGNLTVWAGPGQPDPYPKPAPLVASTPCSVPAMPGLRCATKAGWSRWLKRAAAFSVSSRLSTRTEPLGTARRWPWNTPTPC